MDGGPALELVRVPRSRDILEAGGGAGSGRERRIRPLGELLPRGVARLPRAAEVQLGKAAQAQQLLAALPAIAQPPATMAPGRDMEIEPPPIEQLVRTRARTRGPNGRVGEHRGTSTGASWCGLVRRRAGVGAAALDRGGHVLRRARHGDRRKRVSSGVSCRSPIPRKIPLFSRGSVWLASSGRLHPGDQQVRSSMHQRRHELVSAVHDHEAIAGPLPSRAGPALGGGRAAAAVARPRRHRPVSCDRGRRDRRCRSARKRCARRGLRAPPSSGLPPPSRQRRRS